jgi:hypothetical protein
VSTPFALFENSFQPSWKCAIVGLSWNGMRRRLRSRPVQRIHPNGRTKKNDPRLDEHLGVNLDICHLAIALEEPQTAIGALQPAGIKISKIHLRAALKTKANREARATLKHFANVAHMLQVVAGGQNGKLKCFPRPAQHARRQSAIGRMEGSRPRSTARARRAAVRKHA